MGMARAAVAATPARPPDPPGPVALVTALALAVGTASWCMLVWRTYRRARRRALRRLSPALAAELRRHKLDCLHEPVERVHLELLLVAGIGEPSPSPIRVRLCALGHRIAHLRALFG